jgi:hypothetical protein
VVLMLLSFINEGRKSNNSKQSFKESLHNFLLDNPTEDMLMMGKSNYEILANEISGSLVNRLSIPDPLKIIFSDLTYEDLSDQELVSESIEKKILDENEKRQSATFGRSIDIM